MIVTLIVYVLVFCLIYWLIGMIPFPPPIANAKWVFYLVLVIVAIIMLLRLAGITLP